MIVIDVPPAPPSPSESNPSTSTRSSSNNPRTTRSQASQSPDSISHSGHPSLTPGISQPLVYDVPTDLPIPSFGKQSNQVERDLARVYEAVSNARRIAVICGAGISVSPPANIPDFRSSTGLFKRLKEKHPSAGLTSGKDLFDARLFQSQKTSALFHAMISELKQLADVAQPTSFHHLLKRLDVEGRLLRVYTQNIDALEERAGLTFGLGETGDRTLTKRNLVGGKRKRAFNGGNEAETSGTPNPANLGNRSSSWGRSKSDSALIFHQRNQESKEKEDSNHDSVKKVPMFPRVVPLHGSLQTLTCGICAHKMFLPDSTKVSKLTKDDPPVSNIGTIPEEEEEIEDPTPQASKLKRRFSTSPDASKRMDVECREVVDSEGSNLESSFESGPVCKENRRPEDGQDQEDGPLIPTTPERALELLGKGEPIPCPTCEVANEVRLVGGLRSRGVGIMKVDVVLYGGQNEGAERVGQCLERDVLGLRDPSEPPVPETLREKQTRERKENKDREKFKKELQIKEEQFRSELALNENQQIKVFASEKEALANGFSLDHDEQDQNGSTSFPSSSQPLPSNRSTVVRPKLKPLPPDLLIVAGTSLKVPGTKRIVREFSKACKARDRRIYPGEEDDEASGGDEEDTSTAGSGPRLKGKSSRKRTETPSSNGDEDGEDEDERDDPNRPIRTILLNYDFPIPAKEWDGVFDFWLRGDLQRAARGLWPDGKPVAARDPFLEAEKFNASGFGSLPEDETESKNAPGEKHQYVSEEVYNHPGPPLEQSWKPLLAGLEETRMLEKKNQRINRKLSRSQTPFSNLGGSTPSSETDFFNQNHASPLSSVPSSVDSTSNSKASGKKKTASKKNGTVASAIIAGANQAINQTAQVKGKGKSKSKSKSQTTSSPSNSDSSTGKKPKKSTSSSDPVKKTIASNKVKKQPKPKPNPKNSKKGASKSTDEKEEAIVDELLSPTEQTPAPKGNPGIEIVIEPKPKRKYVKKQSSLTGSGPFKSVKKGNSNEAVPSTSTKSKP